ncbi:MAG: DUF1552 domain-containing protein [Armatimonadota bacterium]
MHHSIARRNVLRGLGVTLALPWLESALPRAARAAGADKPPTRFGFLYFANGVDPDAWTPTGAGADMRLSEILQPLEARKRDLLVLTDLMNRNSIEGDGHYVKVAPILCGTAITKTTGRDLRSGGVSMDQLMAQHVGNLNPLPSLELSIEPPTTYVDTNVGFTALYGSHISWSTPTTPVSREINPRNAFDRLFRTSAGAHATGEKDRSVLDAVLGDAAALKKRIAVADRLKVDEYLDAVRSVERRIAFDAARRKAEVLDAPELRAEIARLDQRIVDHYAVPAEKRGIDHTGQVRLMMDLIALAFWSDSTRVASFMFANEVSGRNFSFLEGVSGGHHEISHHENNAAKRDQYRRINRWHVAQYAYLLDRLASIREGDGTVLDHSMILLASGMRDGNAHSPYNLPVVLAGKAGGTLATGRHLRYQAKTPLCGLYVGMLRRMGVPVARFGDATEELPGLADPKVNGTSA